MAAAHAVERLVAEGERRPVSQHPAGIGRVSACQLQRRRREVETDRVTHSMQPRKPRGPSGSTSEVQEVGAAERADLAHRMPHAALVRPFRILGTDVKQLGLRLTVDLAMWGIGGLMGAGRTELLMHLMGLWGKRRAGTEPCAGTSTMRQV